MRIKSVRSLWIGLILGLVLISWWQLGVGITQIPLWGAKTSIETIIFWDIRWPRLIACILVGGALGMSGASLQGVLRNPLADPYILGVSSGAGLGAGIAIILGMNNVLGTSLGAMLGACIPIVAVSWLVNSTQLYHPTQYILSGIVVNSFLGAVMMLLLYLADDDLSHIMGWLMGDMSRLSGSSIDFFSVSIVSLGIWLWFNAKTLNSLALGDETATSIGVSVKKTRWKLFVGTSLMTGLAVSMVGMIGFIGLIVPHCLRCLYKDDFQMLLPMSFFGGAIILVLSDGLTRSIITNIEFPVGVITAMIGGPFFMVILKGNSR